MEYNAFDMAILRHLHFAYADSFVPAFMRFISSESFFIIIAFILITVLFVDKKQYFWPRFFFLGAGVGATDAFCAHVLKPYFARLRPCQVFEDIKVIAGCAGQYGFPSNHAANTMALAVFFWLTVSHRSGGALLFLAFLVGISRVCLGVHYPTDVLFGYVVGGLFGAVAASIWRKHFKARDAI